ncbi:MAG: hypothetical protein M1294_00090 [Firmicutes bacterium]|uniref:DUF1440 domain-containing protein n=1 Tax=Sulfobacillus benefaciens TaxID=453960 RepID=A0A2T2X778_9FIRM|nr:hypothetical protein [Bacillota bacterium]MCL5012611.1 hypothetical protein [Bacillota bacterium]PSR30339.1 MAG: hypothetical protein C7B43_06380 [Sulfobacillus benefaciens]HBQ93778.1 hypothetical protein [Sulfobacillus sp.]
MFKPKFPPRFAQFIAAGFVGTMAFEVLMTAAPMFGAPVINVALWDGSFLTLNLKFATITGLVIEIAFGTILAYLYHNWITTHLQGPYWQKGLFFGVVLWGGVMIFGLPVFDHISPLVNNGLMLAPGLFARNFGQPTALIFLAALWGFTLPLSYLDDRWGKNPA